MTIRGRGVASVAALGLAGAVLACSHESTPKAPPRPVWVEEVRGETAVSGSRYSATIQPYEQIPLAFKVGGYVVELRQIPGSDGRLRNLQQGDPVARGALLARVDPADYQEKVNQAKAQVAETQATLAKARSDAARAEVLYAARAMTRPDYDTATSGLAGAGARADGAHAQLEAAQISLRDASLIAPIDGVVLSRSVEAGTLAGTGTVAFTIADLTRVKAVFGVPDMVVERVRVGTPVPVVSETFGGRQFPGSVTAVSPSADTQSRVFNVEVTIPNPDGALKAGMIATVEAAPDQGGIAPGSPMVSVSAVVKSERAGSFAVFVVSGPDETAVARSREVGLGRISGNQVSVESGLAVGDRVVVSGASLLHDGDAVRVIPGHPGE